MGCVVRQNLFALFCADREEHNDLSVMTLNSGKVGRMFTSNVVHALGLTQINETGRSLSLQFFGKTTCVSSKY